MTRRLSKSITVATDSKETPRVVLRFTVEARTPIIVKPNARFYVYTTEGEEGRNRLLLQHADGKKLEILGAKSDFDALDVVAEPVTTKEVRNGLEAKPGDVWLDLILSPDAAIGVHKGRLQLETNHPMAQSFSVDFITRVRSLIGRSPDAVRLWLNPSSKTDGASEVVTLQLNQPGNFSITDVSVTHPEIFKATSMRDRASPLQSVRVELVDELTADDLTTLIRGWVNVTTDASEDFKVQIPVLVAPYQGGTKRKVHQRR